MDWSSPWVHAARPILAFAISLLTLAWLLRSGAAVKILDHPNNRSLHQNPTPRVGGLAILTGMLGGWMGLGFEQLAPVLAATVALALVSFLDDLRHLPVWQRFLAHFLAASVSVLWLSDGQSWLMLIAAILAIVWMTNLFNFMDGSDGLAGGMALFGFAVFSLQAAAMGDAAFASLNAVIAAAALGFLLFNFHPARVFMGDAGSIPLGFLAGLIGFIGWINGVWPAWFPVLVFSPFIVDATLTLLKRLVRGERIWLAHREHYYQRLILLGHGHRKTAWLEYGLMFAVGMSALWGTGRPSMDQAILLGGWAIIYIVLTRLIDSRWNGAGKKHK